MTLPSCSVHLCPFKDIKHDQNYYSFPTENKRCGKWISNIRSKELEQIYLKNGSVHLAKNFTVCSKHFEESQFDSKKKQLKNTAIPTLYLPTPDDSAKNSSQTVYSRNGFTPNLGKIFQVKPSSSQCILTTNSLSGNRGAQKLIIVPGQTINVVPANNIKNLVPYTSNVNRQSNPFRTSFRPLSMLAPQQMIPPQPIATVQTTELPFKISSKTIEITPIKQEKSTKESRKLDNDKYPNENSGGNIIGKYLNIKSEPNSDPSQSSSFIADADTKFAQLEKGPVLNECEVSNEKNDNLSCNTQNIDSQLAQNLSDDEETTNDKDVDSDEDTSGVFTQAFTKNNHIEIENNKLKKIIRNLKSTNKKHSKRITALENRIKLMKRRYVVNIAAIKRKKSKKLIVTEMIRNCQHILTKSQQNIVENILLPSNNKKMNSHKEPVMNLAMDFYETSPKAYQKFRTIFKFPAISTLRKWKKKTENQKVKSEKLIEGEEDNKNRIKNEILSLSILEEIEAEINR